MTVLTETWQSRGEGRRSVADSETMVRTLPDHDRCNTHRGYKLSCDQYESLLARCGQRCEICRYVNGAPGRLKMHIDHRGPRWAVRGLLCNGCNTRLQDANAFSGAAARYLVRPWWKRQCAAHGIPADPRNAQPPVGSAIRNQWGVIWMHVSQDRWLAPIQPGKGTPLPGWSGLYDAYGPHNLAPFDLAAELAAGTLHHSVEYAIRNSVNMHVFRSQLGLPPPEPARVRGAYVSRDAVSWLATPASVALQLRAVLSAEECRRVAEILTEGNP